MKTILVGKVEKSMVNINRDTKIYGSFSSEPGNSGCEFHNRGFQVLGINAIYKSFKILNIKQAIDAMRTLDIKGAGVSMPFKSDVIKHVDMTSTEVDVIGAANTLLNCNGYITAHNTDFTAAKVLLTNIQHEWPFFEVNILGNGGYSKAVQYACRLIGKEFKLFTRDNWDDLHQLHDTMIFNCTPMNENWVHPPKSCKYIDCLISTQTGQTLSSIQASEQFKLYTGQFYPCKILKSV